MSLRRRGHPHREGDRPENGGRTWYSRGDPRQREKEDTPPTWRERMRVGGEVDSGESHTTPGVDRLFGFWESLLDEKNL